MYYFSFSEIYVEWQLIINNRFYINFLLVFDFISLIFFSTVILISRSVMLFSTSYVSDDKYSNRFIFIVLSFVLRMALLIFSPNIISILLGWDGLGVTSYLLVNYYRSEKSYNASILTALTNRLGDIAILILIRIFLSGSLISFSLYRFSSITDKNTALIILIAAITKRAQIPFSAWLPAAIAAPTPVSALVHSSTLVTAGVYLLIRFNFFFFRSNTNTLILVIGAMTILIAGISALMEMDIKKIIALSTLRQLGVIFFSLGIGEPFLAFTHLICHAFFKAIIFISAGSMIHSIKNYQDLRKIGSLRMITPLIRGIILTASIRLCGIPFITGFYSKDIIIEIILINNFNLISVIICIVATFLTAAYSARIAIKIFIVLSRREPISSESDANRILLLGPLILFLPSVVAGWLISGWIEFSPIIFIPFWMKTIILSGIIVTLLFFRNNNINIYPKNKSLSAIHLIWFLPFFMSSFLSHLALISGKSTLKVSDWRWLDYILGKWINSNVLSNYINPILQLNLLISYFIFIIFILI